MKFKLRELFVRKPKVTRYRYIDLDKINTIDDLKRVLIPRPIPVREDKWHMVEGLMSDEIIERNE